MTKLVECVNSMNYSITRGNQYEVEIDPKNKKRYILKNDRNIRTKYGINLFKNVIKAVPESQPILPQVVRNNIADILNGISKNDNVFTYEVIRGVRKTLTHLNLTETNIGISCGLIGVHGINRVYSNIINSLSRYNLNDENQLTQAEITQITNRMFQMILTSYMRDLGYGGVIFSTSITGNEFFEDIDDVMSTFETTSTRLNNPNSGNEIIVYVINLLKDLQVDEDDDIVEDDEDDE